MGFEGLGLVSLGPVDLVGHWTMGVDLLYNKLCSGTHNTFLNVVHSEWSFDCAHEVV